MVKNKGGMYMELRICSCDADIRALAALATEIWHEYFTAIISKEQIDYMVEKFQSYPVLKKAIEEENYTYFLADRQQIQSAQSGCIPCEGLQGYRLCADGYRTRLYYG